MYKRTYTLQVYEWNNEKAAANKRKHGVDLADGVAVLNDERAVTLVELRGGEERYATVGMDGLGRILVVVYTWRNERIRLISARRATARERLAYEAVER